MLHLSRWAADHVEALWREVQGVIDQAALRHMQVPGGGFMSVAMTNCGDVGWVADLGGYRYSPTDPVTDKPWPQIPALITELGAEAAQFAGFDDFKPDACLINRYEIGARMGLHQDKDERDFTQPIVSISLGMAAKFIWGGAKRKDPVTRISINSGDVIVWGGTERLFFHGIAPLGKGAHPITGACRINLTLRKAL